MFFSIFSNVFSNILKIYELLKIYNKILKKLLTIIIYKMNSMSQLHLASEIYWKSTLYIWTCKYFYCFIVYRYIYLCKKHCHLLCSIYKKKLFSLFSLNFSFKKIHKRPASKINRDEQEWAGRNFEILSEHTFWMTPKSFCRN